MKTKWAFVPRALLMWVLFIVNSNTVTAQITADFSATPSSGCAPMFVSFRDLTTWDSREGSAGRPVYWKWNLGNGTVSYLQNPSTTYFTPGTYTIKLLVRNAAGTADSVTKTEYITEPYDYEVGGKKVKMVSLAVPILNDKNDFFWQS